ncbi:DUF3307 domain-containing protein [Bacteroides thetaiotaomicron]|nr:DUF3307 domain-containing protein [Bacteroides thetaiotaomicron]
MNSWLFLSLILAHVIGDFYLQNDKYCAQKEERKFKSLYSCMCIRLLSAWYHG